MIPTGILETVLYAKDLATAEAFYGTAHGAWMEGERAAVEALVALGIDPRITGGYGDDEDADHGQDR